MIKKVNLIICLIKLINHHNTSYLNNYTFAIVYFMFKTQLPLNCPPSETSEQNIFLFRLFVPDDLEESFKNHVELFPLNISYYSNCKAYGLSFFDNLDAALDLLKKENNEGKVIAKVELTEQYGKLTNKATKKGHYTLWPYLNFDPHNVKYEIITIS